MFGIFKKKFKNTCLVHYHSGGFSQEKIIEDKDFQVNQLLNIYDKSEMLVLKIREIKHTYIQDENRYIKDLICDNTEKFK